MKSRLQTFLRSLALFLCSSCIVSTISGYDFAVDGVYYDIQKNSESPSVYVTYQLIEWYGKYDDVEDYKGGYSGDVTIPSTVTYNSIVYDVIGIGNNAFDESTITSISLPNSIKTIEEEAFFDCRQLTSIVLPQSLQSLGQGAFNGCSSLTTVNIPSGITRINDKTFYGCKSLSYIIIPKEISYIGQYAFSGCTDLSMAVFL